MPKEDKTNRLITVALALAIIVSVFTILYVNLPKNREDIKVSDDFDENHLYVENINPGFVIGAEQWEGD